jgi:hypothetical protein
MKSLTVVWTRALAAAVGGLLAVAALAAAQNDLPQTPEKPPAFDQIDKNQDGAVSKTEAQGSWLAGRFESIDANHDGSVSRSEYEKATS